MNTVFAALDPLGMPAFAPGIDWAATMILLGMAALVLIAIGALLVILVGPYVSFAEPVLTRRHRPPKPPPRAPSPPAATSPPPHRNASYGQPAADTSSNQAAVPQHAMVYEGPEVGPGHTAQPVPSRHLAPRAFPGGSTAAALSGGESVQVLAAQRAALVSAFVKARGLLDDDTIAAMLDEAICAGGVTPFEATGDLLDPKRHRVDHTVRAPSADRDGIVAQTLSPGYLDKGRVLLPATVVVYKWAQR